MHDRSGVGAPGRSFFMPSAGNTGGGGEEKVDKEELIRQIEAICRESDRQTVELVLLFAAVLGRK